METNILSLLLRGVALLPRLVHQVEAQSASQTGGEKKQAVLSLVHTTLQLDSAFAQHPIADPDGFTRGLGLIIDGIVACLNASLWAKP